MESHALAKKMMPRFCEAVSACFARKKLENNIDTINCETPVSIVKSVNLERDQTRANWFFFLILSFYLIMRKANQCYSINTLFPQRYSRKPN